MIKKVLIGVAGAVMILAFVAWESAVAIHDHNTHSANYGSLATLLDLIGRFADTGKRAKAAFEKGDYDTARRLYQQLAEHGNTDAMLYAAVMQAKGQGGAVDNVQAAKWFRVLADGGNREAQYALGLSYNNGTGVAQDYSTASQWYQKSAAQGSPAARVNLGVLYLNGQGVGPDRIEAQKWFILAGKLGQKNRAVLDASLTPDEKAQAQKRADEWGSGK